MTDLRSQKEKPGNLQTKLVNIDFELCLNDDNYDFFSSPYLSINKELDYISLFSLTGRSFLFSALSSSEEKIIEEFICSDVLYTTTPPQNGELWWGNRDQLSLKRKWANKFTFSELVKKINLSIASSLDKNDLSSYEKILKRNSFNFSGRGNTRNLDGDLAKNEFYQVFIESKVFEFSILFLDETEEYFFTIQNDQGHFNGSLKLPKNEFESFVTKYIPISRLNEIVSFFSDIEISKPFSVDYILYIDKTGIPRVVATELNARKTFGHIHHLLSQTMESSIATKLEISFEKYKAKPSELVRISPKNKNHVLNFGAVDGQAYIRDNIIR